MKSISKINPAITEITIMHTPQFVTYTTMDKGVELKREQK